MMVNLFSMFDPSIYFFRSCWLLFLAMILFAPANIWKTQMTNFILIKKVSVFLKNEIAEHIPKGMKGVTIILSGLFLFILGLNILALYPFNFAPTSHLVTNVPLALLVWLSIFLFAWFKNLKNTLVHLVPQGTPGVLMMFMVLIELTSNLIRPLTLCVRLTANLVAGHLLMSLLGAALVGMPLMNSFAFSIVAVILTILELAVAFIQGYVFMTLITLYVSEIS